MGGKFSVRDEEIPNEQLQRIRNFQIHEKPYPIALLTRLQELTKMTKAAVKWIHQYLKVNDTDVISAIDKISFESLHSLRV